MKPPGAEPPGFSTMMRLHKLLIRHVVPLFIDRERKPMSFGTGFFVSAGGKHFLVSAGHVLTHIERLYYYIEPEVRRYLSGKLYITKAVGTSNDDTRDVGVLELQHDYMPPYPKVDKLPLPAASLMPGALPREGKVYLLLGFPGSQGKPHPVRRDVLSKYWNFQNLSAPRATYEALGISPETHIAMTFDPKRAVDQNGRRVNFPNPAGMSGSPLWLLYDEAGPNDATFTAVAGVFTRYSKRRRAFVATDISVAVDFIAKAGA